MDTLDDKNQEERQPASGKGWTLWVSILLVALAAAGGYWIWQGTTVEEPIEVAPEPPPPPVPEPEPPPPPPKRSTTGSLVIDADIEGALVYVDGEQVGKVPHSIDRLRPGRYQVRVEMPGYEPFEQEVQINAGRRQSVQARLEISMASLRVESDVPGASVFFDRRYMGTTPMETQDIEPGSHELTVSADGYDMYAETLELSSGSRDIMIRFKEVKLDESVSVIHKHRFGSCQGMLRANLGGIRYETSHKDAFSVSFDHLERFEVDYIERNLNIRVRDGRNYNFTESNGNADALFVFHQRVTEAIEKIRSESP
jgi:hypothetical protein